MILNGSDGMFDGERLSQFPGLRVISSYGIGYDHIDVSYANQRGIMVTHTPDVVTISTAEMAVALLLSLIRELPAYHNQANAHGKVLTGSATGLSWALYGKAVGIVGYGRIGQRISRLLEPFGVTVHYTRAHGPHPKDRERWQPLAELLATSDIVMLVVPSTPDTYHLLDSDAIASMKPGGLVVNIGRGPVVDEAALVSALESGHLKGAALDVFEDEPLIHPGLLNRSNVVLSPHRGTSTYETRARMTEAAIANIVHALEGHPTCLVPESTAFRA
jgi:glyoxylate reductase